MGVVPQEGQVRMPLKVGFRKDYDIGDTARSHTHMIFDRSVYSLQKHDFAFIKRSDGSFTYAILAGRAIRNKKNDDTATEECMTFVMDQFGATKMIRQRNWNEFVCLVCPEEGLRAKNNKLQI